ncbi:MAG: hypothetical protein VR72_20305 [Clostridiaceae bacterium BRH_c20a]|nr:MAG: hypothetical protein VR72_20305 [Clostridiaceae bacterium BRH_c20a]
MKDSSILYLQKEMEKVRSRLHAAVNGDVSQLLDTDAYQLSTEMDKLIVKLMKKEQQIKKL